MRHEFHAHTDASNIRGLDCINKTEELIQYASDIGLNGIAITDHETLTNHIKAIKYLKKAKENGKISEDFKLTLGNEIYLVDSSLTKESYNSKKHSFFHFILLAKDKEGHKQLRQLSTRAWERSFKAYVERVPTYYKDIEEIIGENPGHIAASSACMGSILGKALIENRRDVAINFINWAKKIFKNDFYLEIQPGQKDQMAYNNFIIELSNETNVPVIITNDVHYLSTELRSIHRSYLNAQQADREVDAFYSHTYLMNDETIKKELNYLSENYIEACYKNSNELGEKIEQYDLAKPQIVPIAKYEESTFESFEIDIIEKYKNMNIMFNSKESQDKTLMRLIFDGLKRINEYNEEYYERIELELTEVIAVSGHLKQPISAYFNTMSKIISLIWEKGNSLVGAGRGSAASFLITFLVGITQVDPLKAPSFLPHWRLNISLPI